MTAPHQFQVEPYSKLNQIICNSAPISSIKLNQKYLVASYFPEYFKHLEAKTIVVEHDYVDRDFLEDYAGFYVRCFDPPHRKCVRLHFFSVEFSDDDFKELLSAGRKADLYGSLKDTKNYIGFVVLKYLSETIIGRTCLRTYDDDPHRRFLATRDYEANLFGIPLKVHTLAFQEQDSVVSACATSALWSMFNGTGMLFHHQILSPIEITKIATRNMPITERMIPNEGLTLDHMANAIQQVGLEPLVFNLAKNNGRDCENSLKRAVRAYVDYGIPPLLLLSIGIDNAAELHAVAVTGYRMAERSDGKFQAERIDELYVHDDQVGPFARMTFNGTRVMRGEDETPNCVPSFRTSWNEIKKNNIDVAALYLIVPVYHKIRITHGLITALVSDFNAILVVREKVEWVWDVCLVAMNSLKKDVMGNSGLDGDYRREILITKMPRFLWKATAFNIDGDKLLDLLFDATGIEQNQFFLRAIGYDQNALQICHSVSKWYSSNYGDKADPVKDIIDWFVAPSSLTEN